MDHKNLMDVLHALGVTPIRKSGPRHISIPCLFAAWKHEGEADKHPSMTVSISPAGESWVKCHTCEYKRPLRQAVRELSGKTAGGRLAHVSAWVDQNEGRDFAVDTDWREALQDYTEEARKIASTMYPTKVLEFLASKGVTDPTIIKNFVLWHPEERAMVFPTFSYRQGKLCVIGASARRLNHGKGQKYWTIWEYESYFHLYGEHRLKEWRGKAILLVEGQLDALHCWQCKIPCVAVMGVNVGKAKVQLLKQAGIVKAVLALDPNVYETERRKEMVVDSALKLLRDEGIQAWDEKLEEDPKHLDAETLRSIIKKSIIEDVS